MGIRKPDQYAQAIALRQQGYGYRVIAAKVQVSLSTVITWVKDIQVDRAVAYNLGIAEKLRKHEPSSKSGIRSKLMRDRGHKCECCELSQWNGSSIPLEVHHIDGDNSNNDFSNLKLLCPNCHAQTDSWRRRKR